MTPALLSVESARWQQAVLDYLAAFESFGAFTSALQTFWPALAFSGVVLFAGWFAKWPPAYLSLPILAWACSLTLELYRWWGVGHIPRAIFFVAQFLEGAIALVIVLGLVALAVAARAPAPADRLDRLFWVSSLLAVATVMTDWALTILLIVPWGEPP